MKRIGNVRDEISQRAAALASDVFAELRERKTAPTQSEESVTDADEPTDFLEGGFAPLDATKTVEGQIAGHALHAQRMRTGWYLKNRPYDRPADNPGDLVGADLHMHRLRTGFYVRELERTNAIASGSRR